MASASFTIEVWQASNLADTTFRHAFFRGNVAEDSDYGLYGNVELEGKDTLSGPPPTSSLSLGHGPTN